MIDFRYHAISLIAVLIALTLGLLLGVSIGDSGLVSDFKGDIKESLSEDLTTARAERRQARERLAVNNDFLEQTFPHLVENELEGQNVALIGNDGATRPVLADVRTAVEAAGGRLAFAGELAKRPRIDEIAAEIGLVASGKLRQDEVAYADRVGRAVGRRVARGRANDALRRLVFEKFSGKFSRTRAAAYSRRPVELVAKRERNISSAFEGGVIEGLVAARRHVAGVERLDADPSQIKFYKSLGIPTVDNIDQYSGRYSLVQELAGNTAGDYGDKKTADAPIPPLAGR